MCDFFGWFHDETYWDRVAVLGGKGKGGRGKGEGEGGSGKGRKVSLALPTEPKHAFTWVCESMQVH